MASFNRTSLPPPPEIITYRLGDKLIFVKPALEYEVAIDMAIQEFPELKPISESHKERITFYTTTTVNGKRQNVCISKSAWKPCVTRMLRGEMITILVVDPDSANSIDLQPPPPQYLEIPKDASSELGKSRHRKSRSTDSPRFSTGSVSAESSPRRPSPARSAGSLSASTRRRSWFGKRS
ncbi:hypothetical protein BT96DRAFT_878715 [Gymnopus androsaceus JB14]|uniref:Uncharacterized protein n=1 Tax=Gymnopus androsaceus JB14 TaxID=1447944 RepID=A0A6A4I007_9AGAR|nr:hypothetical protein BT96DRAFT_878715 [Gymnopus androsaceus JB14]